MGWAVAMGLLIEGWLCYAAAIPDTPFWQDKAVRIRTAPELQQATFRKLCIDKENVVYVLTDRGVARVFDDILVPDASFRPLAAQIPIDIAVSPSGDLYYLYADRWLSNGDNGRASGKIAPHSATRLTFGPHGEVIPVATAAPALPDYPGSPWAQIRCAIPVEGGVWYGTPRGAFFERQGTSSRYAIPFAPGIEPPRFRYYAGPRWLKDDAVVDIAVDQDQQVWILTRTGLNQITFRSTTLQEKANWYSRKLRSRNIRFGLTGERRLKTFGDLSSSEIVDTDNDGGWTSYYLGALGAQYAVTRDEKVRRQAWESFGALERLRQISTVPGFFARTLERRGFKYSDVDRWRDALDADWEWKGHTSSDEMTSQTFAHAILWELVAQTPEERARVVANYIPIVDHLLEHDLYLVDVDGRPTLWGRWNPTYVNWFPHSIHDRRLNSAEITAFLQLAYRMTGDSKYRNKAYELFQKQGYLANIVSSIKQVKDTPGYLHEGNDMGNEWNHSDDELAFFNYWVLCRFAFTEDLRRQFLASVKDHWLLEQPERYPIWNFIYAGCGGKDFDAAGAVWTLRGIPLDTITWPVHNSQRGDITRRETNFMHRELVELLPPGERLMARINTQPFILDAGDGLTDLPGDEYLIGYWLGRYVGAIAAPKTR